MEFLVYRQNVSQMSIARRSGMPFRVAILRRLIRSYPAIERLHIVRAEFDLTKRMTLNYLAQFAISTNSRLNAWMVSSADSRRRVT